MALSAEQVEQLEKEWRAVGMSDDAIGKRLAQMVENEATRAESEPEPGSDGEAVESGEAPENGGEGVTEPAGEPLEGQALVEASEDWPICPVCRGMGHIPPQLQPSKSDMRCPDCLGLGEVLTGSLKQDAAILPCNTCNGNGYVIRPIEPAPLPPPTEDYGRRY